jgi:hypothetical protein
MFAALICMLCFFSFTAHAEVYCDKNVKSRFDNDRQNAILKDTAKFDSAYQPANSFDSMYCGAQMTNSYDQIGNQLIGDLTNQINSLVNQIFQQACKAAISPVQNAASQACTQNFSQSYFDPNTTNNAFNNNNSAAQAQVLVCLSALAVKFLYKDITTADLVKCLTGSYSDVEVLNCLIALFAQNKLKLLTSNEINYCLNRANNKTNYCPGTNLNQLLQGSFGSGVNGGGLSYRELFY